MAATRRLIVNADDFGQSAGVNRGIITAHEQGIVTSASLMVRWPAAREAAAYARAHPELSLGLHVDLGEWACRDGSWVARYEVVPVHDRDAVAAEVLRQLDEFHRLAGKDPTHLDAHQHVHRREPARSVVLALAHQLGAPLREHHPAIRYCGDFYGQTADGSPIPGVISVEGLAKILAALGPGIMELGCHPGENHDLDTMYASERVQEVQVLCHPRIRMALSRLNIQLRSFGEVVVHAS